MTSTNLRFKKLLEPGRIGQLELRNRIVMAPMGTNFATRDGYVTERIKNYYEERAKGGVGLIIAGVVAVDAPRGKNLDYQVAISDDKFVLGLGELAEAVHRHGAKIALQLVHAGKLAMVDITEGITPAAPSQTSFATMEALRELTREEFNRRMRRFASIPTNPMTRELAVEDIRRLVKRFAEAAERARKIGFDGVEIHAAHGYLLSSFLSPASNKRQDEYGGDLKNRARFLLEVIKAVREKTGDSYPLWCRIDGREFGIKNGITPEDSRELACMLEEAGIDAVHVSGYGGIIGGFIDAPIVYPAGNLVSYAKEIKKLVKIPVIAVGRISPELGEKLLRWGKVDFIAIGRSFLADPQLPNKLALGKRDDIRACIYCYRCVGQHLEGEPILCTINAATGKEAEFRIQPAIHTKKVVVIGGGPAGMEAARLAALRGHRVTLYEKEHRLGGSMLFASIVNGDNEDFLNWIVTQIGKLPIEVKLGKEVKPGLIESMNPDAIIVAIGPSLVHNQIPGAKARNVFSGSELREMISGQDRAKKLSWWLRIALSLCRPMLRRLKPSTLRWLTRCWMPLGKNVAIIGSDLGTVELAQFLVERGRKVIILARNQELAPEMSIPTRWRVMKSLRKSGVIIISEIECEKITNKGVVITTPQGGWQTIEVDTVVIAEDIKPNPILFHALEDKLPQVYQAGDCAEVRMIPGAITDGASICVKI
ncbi:MAG TPA: FAD-dependent oxidoreductase [Dehalococcoidia bacterium]|nr:FAD-dependent oxidoreductase [Dehalococcoidia bacterium]